MAGLQTLWPTLATAMLAVPAVVAALERPLPPEVRATLESPVERPVSPNPRFVAPLPPPPACDRGKRSLEDVARRAASTLAAKRIPYNSDLLADCSGMAHRVLETLDNRCDAVDRPTLVEARSAKAMAAWYAERGQLVTVTDPLDADDALVPGAIVFFGPPGRRGVSLDRIFHIGVVYDVQRDELGQVQSYRLFHGRRPGKVASITNWHRRENDPPLGNGNEELVAVAWPSPELMPAGMHAVAEEPGDWVQRARQ